jgi:hypothetical protein
VSISHTRSSGLGRRAGGEVLAPNKTRIDHIVVNDGRDADLSSWRSV